MNWVWQPAAIMIYCTKTIFNGFSDRYLLSLVFMLGGLLTTPVTVIAAITSVTPITWNIIGLDSNTPAFGPNRFPVGARVYSNAASEVTQRVYFHWETDAVSNTNASYIYLRDEVNNYVDITIPANGHADAYFEVLVNPIGASFDKTRGFYIKADTVSTPRPRELYVERLVSQGRNAITNLEYREYPSGSWSSVGAGGSFNLIEGGIYEIRLSCYTATQGYEQLESFSTLPFTIFQLQAVTTTFDADTSANFSTPSDKLYLDGCSWESDPNSPNYMACNGVGKGGGTITVTYRVKIIDIGDGDETLMSLIHDFSGSSYHYNSDYLSGARTINLIDPTNLTIDKEFSPTEVNTGGTSTLTFTVTNPNNGGLGSVNFADNLPDDMILATPLTVSNSCSGTLRNYTDTANLIAGDGGLKLINGYVPANGSCTVTVAVTAPTATTKTYYNDSDNLYVGNADTTDDAIFNLQATSGFYTPPSPPAVCNSPTTLATWTMPALTTEQGYGGPPPPYTTLNTPSVTSATSSFTNGGSGTNSISTTQGRAANSWSATGWAGTPGTIFPSATIAPYYEFVIDTTNYGGARIGFDYAKLANGDWQGPGDNRIYVYSKPDNGSFSSVSTTNSAKGSWQTALNGMVQANAAATGTSTTTFRVNATGAGKPAATLYLDNISFRGCIRPEPPRVTTKSFSPNPITAGGTSTMTITINNPNTDTHVNYN